MDILSQGLTDAARAELEELRAEGGGLLRPAAVLERARSANSALHRYFEWDDTAAAEAHRIAQARSVVRAVVRYLPAPGGPRRVRAYVSTPTEDGARAYRAVAEVLSDEALAARAAADLLREATRLQERFGAYATLRPALAALSGALAEITAATAEAA